MLSIEFYNILNTSILRLASNIFSLPFYVFKLKIIYKLILSSF